MIPVMHKNILLRHRTEAGYTLLELLIALFLGLFLIGGAIQIYLSSKQAYDELDRVTYLQENLRYITDTLTREFRHVDAAPGAAWETNDEITVDRDYDCSGGTSSPPYTLRYYIDDADGDGTDDTLYCDDGGTPSPVISHVDTMTVTLINNDDGNPVGMRLEFVLEDTSFSSNSYEVDFTVAFRNLVIQEYNN